MIQAILKGGYDVKIDYLTYLLALKQAGSVNKSALLLHTSPQNVSRVMKQMENEWQVTLFQRRAYGIEFTEAGMEALAMAKDVLTRVAVFRQKYAPKETMAPQGRLTVVATKNASVLLVNDLVMKFSRTYPTIKLDFVEDDFLNCLAVLKERQAVGILPLLSKTPTAIVPQPFLQEYVWQKITTDQVCIIVNQRSPLAQYERVTYNRLRGSRFVIYAHNSLKDGFWSKILHQFIKEIETLFIASNGYVFYDKIVEEGYVGLGCKIASPRSDTLQNEKIRQQIAMIPIKNNGVIDNCLVYNKAESSPTVSCFCNFLQEYLTTC